MTIMYSYGPHDRCLAKASNLDAPGQSYRHREHTDLLLKVKTHQELWDDYGLVGNIEVYHFDLLATVLSPFLLIPTILHLHLRILL